MIQVAVEPSAEHASRFIREQQRLRFSLSSAFTPFFFFPSFRQRASQNRTMNALTEFRIVRSHFALLSSSAFISIYSVSQ